MMKSEGKQRLNHHFWDGWFQWRLVLWARSWKNNYCSKVSVWIWHGAQIPKNICKAAVGAADQRDAGRGGDLEPDGLGGSCFAPEWLQFWELRYSHPWLWGSQRCPGSDVNTKPVSLADQSQDFCRNWNQRWWGWMRVVLQSRNWVPNPCLDSGTQPLLSAGRCQLLCESAALSLDVLPAIFSWAHSI